ncbi:MAG: aspartate--tRNA ligase [Eubacterium sp.]|nr:aspartate--tRNA ligase [Eubacterium sp.]
MSETIKGLHRSHRCTEVSNKNIGEEVTVMGWVQKRRNLGSLIFIDLRDRSGLVQIVFDENDGEIFEKAGTLRSEFVIAVRGEVRARDGAVNEDMKTGDIEITAKELRILSESETPPFPVEEGANTKEELRLKYRYLDLRKQNLQNNLKLRSDVTTFVRSFMAKEGFLEIETPTLCKSTPEGARDYLVPSRVHPGHFYALPQSPQLFKQLLMCSGCDRYIQIAKCYRDEDLRADRQPEFTQIDMELSFVEAEDVMDVNERMLQALFKEVLDVDVQIPFARMTWQEAMDRFGTDKPDTRFEMELTDVTDVVKGCGFGVFAGPADEEGSSVRGLNVKGQGAMSRKKIDKLVESAKGNGAKGLAYLCINEDGTYKSSFAKFMSEEELEALVSAMKGETGDLLLFAADTNKIVWNVLGALRLELAKELELIDESKYNFLWVVDFPQFEWSDEEERYIAMHHPFTMPKEEDIQYIESDPGKVHAQAYDIVLNGSEIGGGSVRIHQSDVQEKMLRAIGFTDEQAHEQFGFLIDAFKYGVPPHAGLAYGLDRLVMHMAGEDNIREVIAFPKNKDAVCLMSEAPGTVDEKQLEELSLRIVKSEE